MHTEYCCPARFKPEMGAEVEDGQVVIDISNEGPEEGFTYDDLDQGKCQAWVWVTVSKFVPNDEFISKT